MTHSDQNHSSSTSLRERLAAAQHEIWSKWMKYLYSKCHTRTAELDTSGFMMDALFIPKSFVDRWLQQMLTPYSELSEQEKESDRHQADKILAILDELDERR